jgi:predicted metal-dependent enzyme (double-stranded beta helix superfamily)
MSIAEPLPNAQVQELVRRLDAAMAPADDAGRCRAVKQVLVDMIRPGSDFLDPRFLAPTPDRYARRLLHRDPQGRYTAIVMVWDRGQGTALHDHAGIWCVECVYQGRIQVTSFNVMGGDPERDLVQFREEQVIQAGVGEAGALIPPFEYHILENALESPAVTLHIYGGEMNHCHVFEPVAGGWLRKYRELSYTA